MARLLTREELVERIAELQFAANMMTAPNQRVCEKCLALYKADDDRGCYCDYESDREF